VLTIYAMGVKLGRACRSFMKSVDFRHSERLLCVVAARRKEKL
jgi:hypothetical protein